MSFDPTNTPQGPSLPPLSGRSTVPSEMPLELPALQSTDTAAPPMVGPSLTPPVGPAQESAAGDIAAWHNNKKITQLWSNSLPHSAYIAITDLGWKRLSTAKDSAHVTLSMLAAHAEQTNATVNVHLSADGVIDEIYVW